MKKRRLGFNIKFLKIWYFIYYLCIIIYHSSFFQHFTAQIHDFQSMWCGANSTPFVNQISFKKHFETETLEEEAIRNGVDPRMLSERLEGISKAQYVYSSPTTSANTENSSPKVCHLKTQGWVHNELGLVLEELLVLTRDKTNLNFLWSPTRDTFVICQLGVCQHMHKIINMWKFWLNWSSKLQENKRSKDTLVAQYCVLSSDT